ncbi:MAG: hypothetical protein ABJN62_16615 [Halioglobus sp.]
MKDKTKQTRSKRQQPKDRVLQARIPEQLDDELRDRAEQLGLSVSTIVRNVLLNTFELVEGVVIDSSQLARTLTGNKPPNSAPDLEVPAIGWQEIILSKNGVCEACNVILEVGQRAAVEVPTSSRPALQCMDCLAALSDSSVQTSASPTLPRTKKRRSKTTSSGKKD